MKAKKIITIVLSVLIIAAICATVALSIVAADEDMTLAQYWAKMTKTPEKFDSETLVSINGQPLSVNSFDLIMKLSDASGGREWTSEEIDRVLQGCIDEKLLREEARKQGITIEKEIIEEYLAYQKELALECLEKGGAKLFEEYCKEMGMTIEEYYAQDYVYQQYEGMFLVDKLVAQEAEARGATTYEERAAVRADLAKTLRGKAEIVINQKCVDKVKREAEKTSVKTDPVTE